MSDRRVSATWWSTVGALVFAVVTTVVGATQGAPTRFLLLDGAVGLLFVLSGHVAWSLRPEVRTGPLLLACGVLWFVGSYAPTELMPVSWLAFSFERYYDVVLALLVLTFPREPLRGIRAVALVALAGAFVLRTVSRLLVGCSCLGPHPLTVVTDDGLFDGFQLWTSAVVVGAALLVAVLAVHRLRGGSAAARRYLVPVAVSGAVAALVTAYDAFELAWFLATGRPLVDLGEPGNEIVAWSIIAAVGLVPLGILLGVLRRRTGQEAIARLAVHLDGGTDPGRLRTALREALEDPTLEVYLPDGEQGWVGSTGWVPAVPRQEGSATTVLEGDDGPLAVVTHDPILQEDPSLVAAAVAVLRFAVENERLGRVVNEQLDEVRASRARLVEAAEEERRRIVRDLHDGAQQRLVGVALSLQQAREAATRADPGGASVQRVDEAVADLLAAVDELRRLARGIHPAILTEEGLGPALAGLVRRSSLPVELDVAVEERLSPAVEATAYFIVAEALTNVIRHAQAGSAAVSIRRKDARLEVEVSDDGVGGARISGGSGLVGMADRLDALSGSLAVDSPPGGGTRLTAVIPCG